MVETLFDSANQCRGIALSIPPKKRIARGDYPKIYTRLLNGGEAAGVGLVADVVLGDADLVADAVPAVGVEPAVDAGYCWGVSSRWFVRNCLRAEPFR